MMGMRAHGGVINLYAFALLSLTLTSTYPSSASSSSSFFKNHTHLCLPNQRDALLRFKNASNITIWDEHVDCCSWDGITCNNITGDVVGFALSFMVCKLQFTNCSIDHITYLSPLYNLQELNVYGENLHGVIPLELSHFSKLKTLNLGYQPGLTMESHSLKLLVQNLTQLKYLNLRQVKISGDPFNALVNISKALIDLDLGECDLHGVLPESIFHLPNLHYLDVGWNVGLRISFPTLNWSSPLESLYLSYTNFSDELPNSIGNLKKLKLLYLSSLHISNPLPSSVQNLTRLSILSISSFTHKDAIPSLLCHLSSLQELRLPDNKFSGMIPRCLGNLTYLQILDLSNNMLTGLSPSSSANFTNLAYLFVRSNIIRDTVTDWLQAFPNLYAIELASNNFYGEITPSICKNTPAMVDLSNNSLTGTIPPCLLSYRDIEYRTLNLRMNNLEAGIPDTFPLDCNVVVLDLSENQLKGRLPRTMVNCKGMVVLQLRNNGIEDGFPNWLETLPTLQVLILKSNKFHGEVKTLLNHHPFPELTIFDISNNNFTGSLPSEYIAQFDAMKYTDVSKVIPIYLWNLPLSLGVYSTTMTMKGSTFFLPKVLEALKVIDFSNNSFHGEIPKIIGNLIALKGLNLSHNNLIGDIPSSIQNMTSLEWLDLSSNKLTGWIPNGLAQLTELGSLDLSHNELRGMIPKGKQFDTFGEDSFTSNVGLCGSQIAVECGKPQAPQRSPLPYIQEDDFYVFDWKIILTGYGCGLAIGLSFGYIIFELRRPEWFVSLVEKKLLKKIMRLRSRDNRLCRG